MHNKPEVSENNGKPEIVLAYNKTKGGVDAMDQMAHAFTVKRKTKRWPLVIFFNIIDLLSIAARAVNRMKFSTSNLSYEDTCNRQAFNINIGRSLAVAHIQRRSAVPTLQDPIRQNISTVLNSLAPQCTPATGALPSKRAKADGNAKQKRCSFCNKRDRKTRSKCCRCMQLICKEHSLLCCKNCGS
ncbi:PiggyBac transposable element-derived protein 4 [Elysia marginata]|uniref:PiggyBac transposable element-derived protein 4 n=1 Tax=Elysia marginata TaxID=1093978 RepID=A0AAV4HKP5_9GAST|nr:PiggyBac transposable element-derived protein 4 [Elysia marginata]